MIPPLTNRSNQVIQLSFSAVANISLDQGPAFGMNGVAMGEDVAIFGIPSGCRTYHGSFSRPLP